MSHKTETVASNRSSTSSIGVQSPHYVRFTQDKVERTWVHVIQETFSSISVYLASCIQRIKDLFITLPESPVFVSESLDSEFDFSSSPLDGKKYGITREPVVYSLKKLENTSLPVLLRLEQQTSLVLADIQVLQVAIDRIQSNLSEADGNELRDQMKLIEYRESLRGYLGHLALVIKEKKQTDEEYKKYQRDHKLICGLHFDEEEKEFRAIKFKKEHAEKLIESFKDGDNDQKFLAPLLIHIDTLKSMVKYWDDNGGHEGLTDLPEAHVAIIRGIVSAYRGRNPIVLRKMFAEHPFMFLTEEELKEFSRDFTRSIASPIMRELTAPSGPREMSPMSQKSSENAERFHSAMSDPNDFEMSASHRRIFELLLLQLPALVRNKAGLTPMQKIILNQMKAYLAKKVGDVVHRKASYDNYFVFREKVIEIIPNFASGIDELKKPENGYFFIALYLEMLSEENQPALAELTYMYLKQGEELFSYDTEKTIQINRSHYQKSVTRNSKIYFASTLASTDIEKANAQAKEFVGEENEWLDPLMSVVGPQGSPEIMNISSYAYNAMSAESGDWQILSAPGRETSVTFTKILDQEGKIVSLEVVSKAAFTVQARHKDRVTVSEVLPLQMEFTLQYSIKKGENGTWIKTGINENSELSTIDPVIAAENAMSTLDASISSREFFEFLHSRHAEESKLKACEGNRNLMFVCSTETDPFANVNTLVEHWMQNPEAFDSFDRAKRGIVLAAYFYGQKDEEKLKKALQNERFLRFVKMILPYSQKGEAYDRIASMLVSLGLHQEDENRFKDKVRGFSNDIPESLIYLTGGSLYAHILNPALITADDRTQKFVEFLKANCFFVRKTVESWKTDPQLKKQWKPREIEFLVAAYLALGLGEESPEPYTKTIREERDYYERLQKVLGEELNVHAVTDPYKIATDKLLLAVSFLEDGNVDGFKAEMEKEAADIALLEVKFGIDILAFFKSLIEHCEGDGTNLKKKHEIARDLVKLTPIFANIVWFNIKENLSTEKAKKTCGKVYLIASAIKQQQTSESSTDPIEKAEQKRLESAFKNRIQKASNHLRGGALITYMENPNRFLGNDDMNELVDIVTGGVYFIKKTVDGWESESGLMKLWNEREIEILVAAYIALDLGKGNDYIQPYKDRVLAEKAYYEELQRQIREAYDLSQARDPYKAAVETLHLAIFHLRNGNQALFKDVLQKNEAQMNLLKVQSGVDVKTFLLDLIDYCKADEVKLDARREIALQMAKLQEILPSNLADLFKTEKALNRYRWAFEITKEVLETKNLAQDISNYIQSGKKDLSIEKKLMDRMMEMRPILFFEEFFWDKDSNLAMGILRYFDPKVTSGLVDFLKRRKLLLRNREGITGLLLFDKGIKMVQDQTMSIEAYDANIELLNAALIEASEDEAELNYKMVIDYYRRGKPPIVTYHYKGKEVPGITPEEFHHNLIAMTSSEKNFSLWDKTLQRLLYSQYMANMGTAAGSLKGAFKLTILQDDSSFATVSIGENEYTYDLNMDFRKHDVETIDENHKVMIVTTRPSITLKPISGNPAISLYLLVPEGFAELEQKVYLELQDGKVVATKVEERILVDGKEVAVYNKDAILQREALAKKETADSSKDVIPVQDTIPLMEFLKE